MCSTNHHGIYLVLFFFLEYFLSFIYFSASMMDSIKNRVRQILDPGSVNTWKPDFNVTEFDREWKKVKFWTLDEPFERTFNWMCISSTDINSTSIECYLWSWCVNGIRREGELRSCWFHWVSIKLSCTRSIISISLQTLFS